MVENADLGTREKLGQICAEFSTLEVNAYYLHVFREFRKHLAASTAWADWLF